MKKRLFLALPACIDDYKTIQDDFADIIDGRWVPPENLHLTLSFYGDKFEKDELLERLSSVIVEIAPSTIKGLGYFEKRKILYANIENPALSTMYETLNTLFDLPVKHTFVAHVTLMRLKELVNREKFYDRLDIYKEREIGSLGSSLELMQSELHPDGARYTLLKRF
ncbi:MAG: RNA 2',3'-cyclic phosphodiesterase [Campylobacterota bacterium]